MSPFLLANNFSQKLKNCPKQEPFGGQVVWFWRKTDRNEK
jgi:hypothetical protein